MALNHVSVQEQEPCLGLTTLGFRLVASGFCSSEGVNGAVCDGERGRCWLWVHTLSKGSGLCLILCKELLLSLGNR